VLKTSGNRVALQCDSWDNSMAVRVTPGRSLPYNDSGQDVHIHVPLSTNGKSHIDQKG